MKATDRNTIEEKLPLYVNGSLTEEECRQIEHVLSETPDLEKEVEWLEALQMSLQQGNDVPPIPLSLARLKRDIQREDAASQPKTSDSRHYWKPLALTACLILAVQTGFQLTSTTSGDWAPLSGNTIHEGPQLRVAFHADATVQQINESLVSRGSRIVDGPGALGLYTVMLPTGSDVDTIRQEFEQLAFVDEVSTP